MEDGRSLHRTVFEASTVPTLITDDTGCVVDCNRAYEVMSGRNRDALLGSSTLEFVHADDLPGMISGLDLLMQGEPAVRQQRHHLTADGTWLAIEVITSLIANPKGGNDLVLVQTLDHARATGAFIDPVQELLTRQLYQPAGDGAGVHGPDGSVVFASASLTELLGRPDGWMNGRRFTDPELDPRRTDGEVADEHDDPVLEVLRSGAEATTTLGVTDADGTRLWLSIVAGPVEREALPVRSGVRDITELVEAQHEAARLAKIVEEQLTFRADHDDLTGLVARRVIIEKIDAALAAGEQVSVVFVDLDGFKAVNDEIGHTVGDRVLIEVADHLRTIAGGSITLGRTGGDEFVAVTPHVAAAEAFAAEVREATDDPGGLLGGTPVPIGASVGVAHAQVHDTSTTLLARADSQMYESKRARRIVGPGAV